MPGSFKLNKIAIHLIAWLFVSIAMMLWAVFNIESNGVVVVAGFVVLLSGMLILVTDGRKAISQHGYWTSELYRTLLVISGFVFILAIPYSIMVTSRVDARFESSDGLWADGTGELKGRHFKEVLLYYELYRFSVKKPELTLIRITPTPRIPLFWSKEDRESTKWKVPFGKSLNKAKIWTPHNINLTDAEYAEIKKRAEETYNNLNGK